MMKLSKPVRRALKEIAKTEPEKADAANSLLARHKADKKAKKIEKREVSDKERERLADKGNALPDGSYPIANESDLKNAIQAYGRAKDPAKVKAHIISRAKELGREDLIPENW